MAIINNITTSIMKINVTTIPIRHVTIFSQIVLTLVYVCGIIGNIAALITLFHRDKVSYSVTIKIIHNFFLHWQILIVIMLFF